MDVQILFYEGNGKNVPILVSNVDNAEFIEPSDAQKQAIYEEWPEAKGHLKMLWQGVVFSLDEPSITES
jgi:hypothetical protein